MPQRAMQQNQKWPTSGQGGYITPATWGVPTASERGAESEVFHEWARWLHNCRGTAMKVQGGQGGCSEMEGKAWRKVDSPVPSTRAAGEPRAADSPAAQFLPDPTMPNNSGTSDAMDLANKCHGDCLGPCNVVTGGVSLPSPLVPPLLLPLSSVDCAVVEPHASGVRRHRHFGSARVRFGPLGPSAAGVQRGAVPRARGGQSGGRGPCAERRWRCLSFCPPLLRCPLLPTAASSCTWATGTGTPPTPRPSIFRESFW